MSDAFVIVIPLLALILVGAAIFAVSQKDLLLAVIGTSIVSLILSVMFFILQAPDVALTEAAIGVALTTIIFIITIKKTTRYEE
ncbi:MAG: hydrogenase subunit MbhD domain-containing protein [Candidatus Marinimicrobia bacterium]|nr:hydrogenase subunit MbhD domain-containing protein [Candidatus Neomarinimicrobiota bacterium]